MLRIIISVLLGCTVALLLFLFMSKLIENKQRAEIEPSDTPIIDPVMQPQQQTVTSRETPPPPPQVISPPPSVALESEPNDGIGQPDVQLEQPGIPATGNDLGLDVLKRADGDAQPIVRVEPKYPIDAATAGTTGYVIMEFTILADGTTDNIQVVEEEPRRTFGREAVRALKKWKYRPKVVDGEAVEQPGIRVRLDFNLDS